MRGTITAKCMRRRSSHTRCTKRCLRWYYVLASPPGPNQARRRQWSKGHPTREEAEVALVEELHRRDNGSILSPEKITLSQFTDRWLQYMRVLGRDERTLERYQQLIRLHALPAIGGLQVKAVRPIHLSDLYYTLLREGRRDGKPGGLHPRTVGHLHRALHRMLKQAVRWQLIHINPAADLELPTVPDSKMATLTPQQATLLLHAADPHPLIRHLVLLGLATGARLGELLALCWTDIDLTTGTVKIGWSRRIVNRRMEVKGPKTQAGSRTIILGPATLHTLRQLHTQQAQQRLALGSGYHPDTDRHHARQQLGEDQIHDEYLVICKPDGRPYRPDSTSSQFRKLIDGHGLPKTVHVHTLRHSAASFLAAAGTPASDIAAQLGHKDGGALALKVYIHPMAEGLTRAGAHLDHIIGQQQ